jgi:hypothetical protein
MSDIFLNLLVANYFRPTLCTYSLGLVLYSVGGPLFLQRLRYGPKCQQENRSKCRHCQQNGTHQVSCVAVDVLFKTGLKKYKRDRDGWLSWQRACLLRQLSGLESGHLSKIKKGRQKQRSSQQSLARQFFFF